MTDALEDYLMRVSVREPDVLRRLRLETAEMPRANMQISATEGRLLQLLVKLTGATRALEVGVFTGYSSTALAMALPEQGLLVACDVDEATTNVARRYWDEAGVAGKIRLELGPAAQTLARYIDEGAAGSFDFAFIDADKENYDVYYEASLVLLRSGGLIAIDNALWGGRVADETASDPSTLAIHALNIKVGLDPRVTATLVPVADGLLLARKN